MKDVFANELPQVNFGASLNDYRELNLKFESIIHNAEQQALRKLAEHPKKRPEASAAYTVAFIIYEQNEQSVHVISYTRGHTRVFVIQPPAQDSGYSLVGTNKVDVDPSTNEEGINDWFGMDLSSRPRNPLHGYWGKLPKDTVCIVATDGVYKNMSFDELAQLAFSGGGNSATIVGNIMNRIRIGPAVKDNRSVAVYVPAEQLKNRTTMTNPNLFRESGKSGLPRVFDFFKRN